MLFASAAAWYKRFLNLANPNRGRASSRSRSKGRGNARPNSRADRSLLAHPPHARLPDLPHAGR